MSAAYQAGREAFAAWANSPQCAQFDRNAPAEVAAQFFLPPVDQVQMQMVTPLPAARREWLRGFEDARAGR